MEVREQLGQDRQRAPAHHPDRDLAADQAGQLVHGQPGAVHRVQRGPGERQHGGADLGEPDRPAGTVKQLLAELRLQPADLRADAGLGDVHSRRRPGEAGLLGHGDEVLKLVDLHNH